MHTRFIATLSCRALLGLGYALVVVAVVRFTLALREGAFGCAFIRTDLLDPWLWIALVTGASCVGFAQLQRAILHPESEHQASRIVLALAQPGDIGESAFWGEVAGLFLGAGAILLLWLLDAWC